MTIQQLKEFLVLCEYRNYTKAADALYLTTSALSRHISTLEASIGSRLILRSNSVFELTETGIYLFENGKDLLDKYNELLNGLSGKTDIYNTLSVSSAPFNHEILFKTYHDFQEKNPTVNFSLKLIPFSSEAFVNSTKTSDILIYPREYFDSHRGKYNMVTLFEDVVNIIGSKTNPLYNPNSFCYADLANAPLLLLKEQELIPSTYQLLESHITGFNLIYQKASRLNANELYYLLRAGNGWTVFPTSLANEFAHDCNFIPLVGDGSCFNIIMAWRTDNQNPHITSFRRIIQRNIFSK